MSNEAFKGMTKEDINENRKDGYKEMQPIYLKIWFEID